MENKVEEKKPLGLKGKLLEIQKVIASPTKKSDNPYFKSKYADLEEVRGVIIAAMETTGQWILIQQIPLVNYDKIIEKQKRGKQEDQVLNVMVKVPEVSVKTILTDLESGESEEFTLPCYPSDDTPQAIGSSITYMRRYELLAIFNLSPADDDGNAGSGRDDLDQRPPQTNGKASKTPAKYPANKPAPAERVTEPAPQTVPTNGKQVPTDVEQEKRGLISNAQVEMVSKLYKQKGIPKEALSDWLGIQFANKTPWGIPKTKFSDVCNVILKTPEEITGPKNETPANA